MEPRPESEIAIESAAPGRWPRRRKRWLVAGTAAIAIAAALVLVTRPRQLEPGECVSEPGVYRSPGGGYRITIFEPSDGFKSIALTRRRRRFWIWYEYVAGRPTLVDQERDWFHCFDQYDRLWNYHGRWNKAWGATRQHPGGGYSPHTPAVILEGAMYSDGRGPMMGSSVVSEVGNWEGIPGPFFDRIPDKDKPIWGDIPPIPSAPPEFTPAQEMAIRKLMSRR